MVKHLTHNPKNEGLNPATDIVRVKNVWIGVDLKQQPNGKTLDS
jgi:hypothetical protein